MVIKYYYDFRCYDIFHSHIASYTKLYNNIVPLDEFFNKMTKRTINKILSCNEHIELSFSIQVQNHYDRGMSHEHTYRYEFDDNCIKFIGLFDNCNKPKDPKESEDIDYNKINYTTNIAVCIKEINDKFNLSKNTIASDERVGKLLFKINKIKNNLENYINENEQDKRMTTNFIGLYNLLNNYDHNDCRFEN